MNSEVDSRRRNLKISIPANIVRSKKHTPRVEPLRVRAKSALLEHLNNELRWEKLITQQMFYLLERVYAISGDEYEVALTITGSQVKARIEDIEFISTYYEVHESLPSNSRQRFFGVRLWWECAKCDVVATSDVIFTTYELAQQLEIFYPKRHHRCIHRTKESPSINRKKQTMNGAR